MSRTGAHVPSSRRACEPHERDASSARHGLARSARAGVRCPFLLALALLACTHAPREPKLHAPAVPTHFLGEWFAVEQGRCRLLASERAISERQPVEPGRVAEDVTVVSASFACEDAHGNTASPRALLASEPVRWLDEQQHEHPPSRRTKLAREASAQLVFEVPPRVDGVPQTRRYDARSGDPLEPRERRHARLRVGRAVVAPWARLHDRALDGLLDRLARTLATGALFDTLSETPEGHQAIDAAASLYARALARFSPKLLRVRAVDLPRITLALEKGASPSEPVLSFTFELAASGALSIAKLLDADSARAMLDCNEAKDELTARVLRARREHASEPSCNVLGLPLPGSCARVDAALASDVLRIKGECEDLRPLGLDQNVRGALPLDFGVRLRRGPLSSLDPSPRQTLEIERSGRMTFARESAAGPRTSEGRTSPLLLAALHARLERAGFFERARDETCKPDERGDTLTVRANGRERSLRDRQGCRGPFSAEELAELQRAVAYVAGLEVWTGPASNLRMDDPEIWIVAAE